MDITLDSLLKYRHEKLIARYENDFPQSRMSGEQALNELLKYIWLCCKHQTDKAQQPENPALHFNCVMHTEMADIDHMWHTFLLFTKDYQTFCHTYLAQSFFHHEPTSPADHETMTDEAYETELSRYTAYIYDQLGAPTLISWFKLIDL